MAKNNIKNDAITQETLILLSGIQMYVVKQN